MNEQLKQIAFEDGQGGHSWYNDPTCLAKFAELIANECAKICVDENVSALSIDELNNSAFKIQDLATKSCGAELSRIIKKRFGV